MALKPLSSLPKDNLKPKRALLSVYDKDGIYELAKVLHEAGVELISTGGTSKLLKENNLPVKDVSEITNFPECLDGRVKTLHPMVHGGILARTSFEKDVKEIKELGITPIDLVVVNLYPFKEIITEKDINLAKATEFIDIGGPTMLRASSKNFAHVCVLSNPNQYKTFTEELTKGDGISFETRLTLAKEGFRLTADYDTAISNYLMTELNEEPNGGLHISLPLSQELRYGENPHQKAAVYGNQDDFIDCFHGKQLSYNNFLDVDAALSIISTFPEKEPSCAIIKHTIPCGVGTAKSLKDAYEKAFATDTVSPFGGIVVVNQELDLDTAKKIDEIFTEIIIAPSFSSETLELLSKKQNRRLIKIKKNPVSKESLNLKTIFGGILKQDNDSEKIESSTFEVVTERQPSADEMADLLFAWNVVRNVKSNAIVYAKNGGTLGIGSGQTSRIDSSEIAISKAKKEGLNLENCVIASDAFFPFSDGVEAAAQAGAVAVIQPGGSVRDQEVIATANNHNMTMIFTGKRHFKH